MSVPTVDAPPNFVKLDDDIVTDESDLVQVDAGIWPFHQSAGLNSLLLKSHMQA